MGSIPQHCEQCGEPFGRGHWCGTLCARCWRPSPATRFLVNTDLPRATDNGVRLHCIRWDMDTPRIVIEVSDRATSDELRAAIPLALRWRDWLKAHRGPDWDKVAEGLARLCVENRRRRTSYERLAVQTNTKMAALLTEWVKYTQARDEARATQGEPFDELEWWLTSQHRRDGGRPDTMPLSDAEETLRVFRFSDSEILEQICGGLERIGSGDPPFEAGYPLDRDRVIMALRLWRKRPEHAFCPCQVPAYLL
jgi:hypothetical protein